MKNFKFLIFSILLLPVVANAYDAQVDDIYYNFHEGEAWVTFLYYDNNRNEAAYSGTVVIPEAITYDGVEYVVTGIEKYAFSHCTNLTSVSIPETVKHIGDRAFQECPGLTSFVVPDSVTSFGIRVFLNSPNIASIVIGNGVTSIGEGVFSNCYALTDIVLGTSVQSIGYLAFQGCRSLPSITLPEGVRYIDSAAFYGCSSLVSVSLPNSLTVIYSQAFEGCSKLTSFTVGSELKYVGDRAFEGCNIKSLYVSIADYSAFCYKSNTILLQIKNQITLVDGEGNEVTEYVVPEGVTSIGDYAFASCSGLTGVSIPGSVTSIGEYAFNKCEALTSAVVPEGVTSIGRHAFANCTNLKHVSLPNSVTKVGASPFSISRNITSVCVDCEVIGNWFASQKNLKFITLGEHVKEIGKSTFKNCTGLKEVYCYAKETPEVDAGSFGGVETGFVLLVVPDESFEAYKAHDVWSQFLVETPTVIVSSFGEKKEGAVYNLSGRRLQKMQKGIVIKDGRKVLK